MNLRTTLFSHCECPILQGFTYGMIQVPQILSRHRTWPQIEHGEKMSDAAKLRMATYRDRQGMENLSHTTFAIGFSMGEDELGNF